MISCDVNNTTEYKHNSELIENILEIIDNDLKIPEGSNISLAFVNNEKMQELNKIYYGIDAPTDVLSFDYNEMVDNFESNYDKGFLGEIIIASDVMEDQSKKHGNDIHTEFALLFIHGFLHILGYDHCDPKGKKEMELKQNQILNFLQK